MEYGDVSLDKIDVLNSLIHRRNYAPIGGILNDIELEWFQNICLSWSLIVKNCVVTLDTGLGKTIVATAYMRYVTNLTGKKFIYVCERGALEQTASKITKYSGLKCIKFTGEKEVVEENILKGITGVDVILITYQALQSFTLNQYLVSNIDKLVGLVIDECQHLGDRTSITTRICKSISNNFQYKLFLSATPFKVKPEQFLSVLNVLDRTFVPSIDDTIREFAVKDESGKIIEYDNLDVLQDRLKLKVIGFTRKELGLKGKYNVKAIIANPSKEEREAVNLNMWKVIKGNPNNDNFERLCSFLNERRMFNKKGLIYCNTNSNKNMLRTYLAERGFKVAVIDGTLTKKSDRPLIQQAFSNNEYDVLITNITTGLDLQCDFVLFWELTLDFKQMIGRGERGIKGNNLEIVFILTKDTVEISYFEKNVYRRSLLLKEMCSKDNDELESILKQVQ